MSARNPDLLKADWQQMGRLLKEPHLDSHGDWGASSDCSSHDDHTDRGIGLAFPEQPPISIQGEVRTTEPAAQQTFVISCPAPGCRMRLNVLRRLAGQSCRCPGCGTTIHVPVQTNVGPDVKPDF